MDIVVGAYRGYPFSAVGSVSPNTSCGTGSDLACSCRLNDSSVGKLKSVGTSAECLVENTVATGTGTNAPNDAVLTVGETKDFLVRSVDSAWDRFLSYVATVLSGSYPN